MALLNLGFPQLFKFVGIATWIIKLRALSPHLNCLATRHAYALERCEAEFLDKADAGAMMMNIHIWWCRRR